MASEVYWTCEHCGLRLSFKEVCASGGHDCTEDDDNTAADAASDEGE